MTFASNGVQAGVRFDRSGSLAALTFDAGGYRPNAVGLEQARELSHRVNCCAADPTVRCLLIQAAGGTFHVGGDLQEFATVEDLPFHVNEITAALHSAVHRLRRMTAPIVVAVSGSVGGGGLGLGLLGDIVLASSDATFTAAYTACGLSPDVGTTWLLPRLVGYRRAQQMLMLNRRVTAEEAERWGMITAAVDPDQLAADAWRIAERLAGGPTLALARAKTLLDGSYSASLAAQLEDEAQAIAAVCRTEDAREGISGFLGKRAPTFHGR